MADTEVCHSCGQRPLKPLPRDNDHCGECLAKELG